MHRAHEETAARWRPGIAQALSGLLPDRAKVIAEVVHHVEGTQVDGDIAEQVILSVLSQHVQVPEHALDGLYVDGYARGRRDGARLVDSLSKDEGDEIDWSDWVPGDVAAAKDLLSGINDASVLQDLLNQAGVTIKSISANRMDDLARALADNISTGSTNADLATVLAGILDDPSRADMVANTETTRVLTAGQYDSYRTMGVQWVSFLSAEDARVEELCNENESEGAIAIWDDFTNGSPPVHPNCRCTIVPATGPEG
jgi:SPP1 gp7 family putative phage head morphogenesis protein